MQKIIKYIPIMKNLLMRYFTDLADINIIKYLSNYIIVDNYVELDYLYCKTLVKGNLEMIEALNKILTVKS